MKVRAFIDHKVKTTKQSNVSILKEMTSDQVQEAAREYIAWVRNEHRRHLERVAIGKRTSVTTRATQRRAHEKGFRTHTEMRGTYLYLGELASTSFRLGNGQEINWGLATIAQHRERIAYMKKKMAGMQRDVDAHEETIRFIRNAKCATLIEALERQAA